jgi:hypothetical protein
MPMASGALDWSHRSDSGCWEGPRVVRCPDLPLLLLCTMPSLLYCTVQPFFEREKHTGRGRGIMAIDSRMATESKPRAGQAVSKLRA